MRQKIWWEHMEYATQLPSCKHEAHTDVPDKMFGEVLIFRGKGIAEF